MRKYLPKPLGLLCQSRSCRKRLTYSLWSLNTIILLGLGTSFFPWQDIEGLLDQRPYGPIPQVIERKFRGYQFAPWNRSFRYQIPLARVAEVEKKDMVMMVSAAIPRFMPTVPLSYLRWVFEYSERYRIDPFWVLAVMWTESHFKPKAVSSVNAIGLMQIMPGTGHYLSKKLGRPISPKLAYAFAKDPRTNIQLGTFYLSRLLKRFNGNYRMATVAYNMGPSRVKRRLAYGLPTGVNNHYLNKVRHAYRYLTSTFIDYVETFPSDLQQSYAMKQPGRQRAIQFLAKQLKISVLSI